VEPEPAGDLDVLVVVPVQKYYCNANWLWYPKGRLETPYGAEKRITMTMNRRNKNSEPLTDEQLQVLAPSAFAGQAHDSRSNRYTFIPTIDVISGLRDAGFAPVFATQSSSRIAGKQFFTKHMIRFRSQSESLTEVGDTAVELAMTNSHDGTSVYEFSLGAFRLACLNGMMVSEGLVQSVKVRHTGNIIERVVESTRELIQYAPTVVQAIAQWKAIQLTVVEQKFLAEGALALRYDENAPLAAEKLLEVRRHDDNKNDLWTVFNRIQENLLKGGQRYYRESTPGDASTQRRMKTRSIKGIDQDTKLNRQLWALTTKMADLKS